MQARVHESGCIVASKRRVRPIFLVLCMALARAWPDVSRKEKKKNAAGRVGFTRPTAELFEIPVQIRNEV